MPQHTAAKRAVPLTGASHTRLSGARSTSQALNQRAPDQSVVPRPPQPPTQSPRQAPCSPQAQAQASWQADPGLPCSPSHPKQPVRHLQSHPLSLPGVHRGAPPLTDKMMKLHTNRPAAASRRVAVPRCSAPTDRRAAQRPPTALPRPWPEAAATGEHRRSQGLPPTLHTKPQPWSRRLLPLRPAAALTGPVRPHGRPCGRIPKDFSRLGAAVETGGRRLTPHVCPTSFPPKNAHASLLPPPSAATRCRRAPTAAGFRRGRHDLRPLAAAGPRRSCHCRC